MTARPALLLERNMMVAAYATDSVRDGIAAGRFVGLRPDNEMLAALFDVLENIEWAASADTLMQALPHAPAAFTLSDLQSTLVRVGVSSRVSRLGRRDINGLPTPAILLGDENLLGVLIQQEDGTKRIIDPLTRDTLKKGFFRKASIVTFSKLASRGSEWFAFDLFHRSRHILLGVLATKLVINLITMLAAISVFAIFDKVVAPGAADTLFAIAAGMSAAFAVNYIYRIGKARLLARFTARLEFLISSLAFRQVASLPLDKLVASTVTQQIARLRPLNTMASSVAAPLIDIVTEVPFALLLTGLLFYLAGPIGVLPIAVFVVFTVSFALMLPGIRRLEDQARLSAETHMQTMSDVIVKADVIRLNNAQAIWKERAAHAIRRKASDQRKAEMASRRLSLVGAMATPIAGGGTAIVGAALAINGNLSAGGLIAAMILSWKIIAPMQTALTLVSKWSDMFRLVGQLNRLMRMPNETDQFDAPVQPEMAGHVELSGIAHRYGGTSDWALRNVSANIPAGSFVTVTGASGAGKSTLLRMLPALFHPTAGTVFIDGINIRQLPISQLRKVVSYVPFEPVLIHGTISQNLRLAHPLASDEEVFDALSEVGLEKIIARLPGGLETRLTDEIKSTLPKGFKQALAIAQALMTCPKILVLDEPTRSLDPHLEQAVLQALLKQRGQMTTIMVTHRPSHSRVADMVLALEAGRLINIHSDRKEAS